MGVLNNRIEAEAKQGIPQYYKDNTFLMLKKYQKPDELCKTVPISDIFKGGFYFFMYMDESNWMQLSPVFVADYADKKVIFAVNFNFIPLEIRNAFFDKHLINFTDNTQFSGLSFEKVYKELLRYGFEYALVEYEIRRLKMVFQIDLELLPNFLYSSHPKNKYDPQKLYDIWAKKITEKEERFQELVKTTISDFYKTKDSLIEEKNILKDHFQRLKRNQDKF